MTVSEFIAAQPAPAQSLLTEIRNQILAVHPAITEKIRYGVPFFDYHRMMCYLSPKKTGAVEICFAEGLQFPDHHGVMALRNRKHIPGYMVDSFAELRADVLRDLVLEAIRFDDVRLMIRQQQKSGRKT